MILLLFFTLLTAFFGWLFINLAIAKVVWFITMPLIIAGMLAAALFLIFVGWLCVFVSEKVGYRQHDCG